MPRILSLLALLVSTSALAEPTRLTVRSGGDTLVQILVSGAVQETDAERCVLRFEATETPGYTVLTEQVAVNINNEHRGPGEAAVNINNDYRSVDEIAVNINNDYRATGGEIAVNINNDYRTTGAAAMSTSSSEHHTVEIAVNINNEHMPCDIAR